MGRWSSLRIVAFASALAPFVARDAAADELATCNAALVRGQELARGGKLLDARATYPGCLRAECNAELRAVCANFVAELTRSVPTLRLIARARAGAPPSAVRFFVDDKPTGGDALEVDPGSHRVRAAAPGYDAAETTVAVGAGEGTRDLVIELAPSTPAPSAPPAERSTKVPVASFVLGGVALVGAGSFAFFALDGKGSERSLRATCPDGPCDSSGMRRSYLVADVSLGVSVVALAAAVVLAFTNQPAPPAAPSAAAR